MRRFVVSCLLAVIVSPSGQLLAQDFIEPVPGHVEVAKSLDTFITKRVEQHHLPALSIALIADQKIVWAKGFGMSDPKRKIPATAQTVYRVGSVSKLFTDLAVMRLVEKGELDLDVPVVQYLPEFKPTNPFKDTSPITLRHLMAHRSGLVREPPIGSYFDPEEPSLEKTVMSLQGTTLVHPPGKVTKYSNAGITVVGRVLEAKQRQAFAEYLQRDVLAPLGMKSSSFRLTAGLNDRLARAIMWTYHGREFAAPTFELGSAPAGCMYSTVLDLGKFASMLFAEGKIGAKSIVGKKTLETMWQPQFVPVSTKSGFGLGFMVTNWKNHRRVGHNGAIYGFATDLSLLPEERLGVVVITSCDCANSVATQIADLSLEHLLAVKNKKSLPEIPATTSLTEDSLKLAGGYASKSMSFTLQAREGRLYYVPASGFQVELRQSGKKLVADDRLGQGLILEPTEEGIRLGKQLLTRQESKKPKPAPEKWVGLIGEYGWDHNVLYIYEQEGKLRALIEWFFDYPLEVESETTFRFPAESGLYPGEKLIFTRDRLGRANAVTAAGILFKRRNLDGEDGKTFRIKPLRSIQEIRPEALKAKPPRETTLFRKDELVELTTLDATIKLDIRYATTNNFLSVPFYTSARAFLQKPAAEALARVHKRLGKQGYGLLIHDGYRPWSVTKMFWEATPRHLRTFVANPDQGSRHNRGCAVDLTLYELKSGKPVEMVGGYDEMSDRSYPNYPGGTSLQRWHRELLRREMEAEGFTVFHAEWWHFDYKDWRKYAIANVSFEEIK